VRGRYIRVSVYDHTHSRTRAVTHSLTHRLLSLPIVLEDLEGVDPELYRSLKWIADCDDAESIEGMDMTFSVEFEHFGARRTVDLKPGTDCGTE
jgi:E3 ubiquitin-protein ligase NEDD4